MPMATRGSDYVALAILRSRHNRHRADGLCAVPPEKCSERCRHAARKPCGEIWCGVLTMGVSLLTWMVALRRLEVSQTYPFTSLGIVLTILDGR
jgi:hypothetical protein